MTLALQTDLAREIKERSGENVFLCYQCKKCTAGCPVAAYFDLTPNQVLRACQFGQTDMVLNSRTIWICAACETCSTRCPQGIDIARIMDVLEIMAQEQGIRSKARTVPMFYKSANRGINWFGRMWELGLMAELYVREFLAGERRKQFFQQSFATTWPWPSRCSAAASSRSYPASPAGRATAGSHALSWSQTQCLPSPRCPGGEESRQPSGQGPSPTTRAAACTPPGIEYHLSTLAVAKKLRPEPGRARRLGLLWHLARPQHRSLPVGQAADADAGHRPGDGPQLHDHALRGLFLPLSHRHARGAATTPSFGSESPTTSASSYTAASRSTAY